MTTWPCQHLNLGVLGGPSPNDIVIPRYNLHSYFFLLGKTTSSISSKALLNQIWLIIQSHKPSCAGQRESVILTSLSARSPCSKPTFSLSSFSSFLLLSISSFFSLSSLSLCSFSRSIIRSCKHNQKPVAMLHVWPRSEIFFSFGYFCMWDLLYYCMCMTGRKRSVTQVLKEKNTQVKKGNNSGL